MRAEKYLIGCDLAQTRDFSAVAVLERVIEFQPVEDAPINYPAPKHIPVYHLRELERMRGLHYTDVVDIVSSFVNHAEIQGENALVVDITGVGRPVYEMMIDQGLDPIGVTIHAGWNVTAHLSDDGTGYGVPKHDIVAALQVLFQTNRMRFNPDLTHLQTLLEELNNMTLKRTEKGNAQYEAEGSSIHDDLVIAVGLAAWFGGMTEDRDPILRHHRQPDVGRPYNPLERGRKRANTP